MSLPPLQLAKKTRRRNYLNSFGSANVSYLKRYLTATMAGDLSKMLDADPNKCNIKMSDLIKPKTDGYAAVYTDKENFESKNADSADDRIVVAQNKYGKLGSVYKSILKHLLERGGWRRKKGTVGRFHLIFGEAQGRGIPWKKFSQCFKYDYGITPLVNYCRGLRDLSSKATMVKTIRSYCERKVRQVVGTLLLL